MDREGGAWSSGLCNIFDCATTESSCLAFVAPFNTYGQIAANLTSEEVLGGGNLTVSMITYLPLNVPGYVVCGYGYTILPYSAGCCILQTVAGNLEAAAMLAAATGIIFGVANAAPLALPIICPLHLLCRLPMRSAIRKRYSIPATDYEDCMTVWCCNSCALKQVDAMPPTLSAAARPLSQAFLSSAGTNPDLPRPSDRPTPSSGAALPATKLHACSSTSCTISCVPSSTSCVPSSTFCVPSSTSCLPPGAISIASDGRVSKRHLAALLGFPPGLRESRPHPALPFWPYYLIRRSSMAH